MGRVSTLFLLCLLFTACAGPAPATAPMTAVSGLTVSIPAPTLASPEVVATTPVSVPLTSTLQPRQSTETVAPTRTAIPFPSATPTFGSGQPTPSVPTAFSPDGSDVRCFKGPGIEYQPGLVFKQAEFVGKDEQGLWWYVKIYDSQMNSVFCWVSDKKVNAAGDLSVVPLTEVTPASVTAVNIYLDGDYTQTVECSKKSGNLEFHFTGEIVTDGPVKKMKYRWETSAGAKFAEQQKNVLAWDSPARFKLQVSVPAREGTYSLTLRTVYPNELIWNVQFMVKCK